MWRWSIKHGTQLMWNDLRGGTGENRETGYRDKVTSYFIYGGMEQMEITMNPHRTIIVYMHGMDHCYYCYRLERTLYV